MNEDKDPRQPEVDQPGDVTSESPALTAAREYTKHRWSVIPVPHRAKNPGFKGWPELRLQEKDLERHFNGEDQNIGVLTGEPSGWLIDIDLDHPRAIELADDFLPPTDAIFGRLGKPRSHRLYYVADPVATKKCRSKSAGMLVELRSTGCQTVFPPSVHESGEPITWENEAAELATVDAEELLDAVTQLADQVKIELGEKQTRRKANRTSKTQSASTSTDVPTPTEEIKPIPREQRCLNAMLRMNMTDQHDGSSRLFAAACRAVEFDLDDSQAVATICEYARQRPFPTPWTDDQILDRVRDAENKCDRGEVFEKYAHGLVRLGGIDPETGKRVLSPKHTLPTAEEYVSQHYIHDDGKTLHCYAGILWAWNGSHYREIEDGEFKKHLQKWLHDAVMYVYDKKSQSYILIPFTSNPSSVTSALDTIKSSVHLPKTIQQPSWLDRKDRPPIDELLPCKSTILHLTAMEMLPPTPALFASNALDFDPDFTVSAPLAWLDFLGQLFGDDVDAIELLQEWFGYCLTADTSQQKMLLLVGPRRSGKGTIARVLRKLIGEANVCGPTTSSLAENFGLQPLTGKSLAIVSDARFKGEKITAIVERLLCISGEDAISVDRKFLESVTLKLPTRFMFLTNELPRLGDASGALAGRFLILTLRKSFYGQEDPQLSGRLVEELPGILNWAIQGWRRLRARGHFQMPASSDPAVEDLEDLGSPVAAFVRERCRTGPEHSVSTDDLFEAWRDWSADQGRDRTTTKQSFGRDLKAAYPEIRLRKSTSSSFYEGIALA